MAITDRLSLPLSFDGSMFLGKFEQIQVFCRLNQNQNPLTKHLNASLITAFPNKKNSWNVLPSLSSLVISHGDCLSSDNK